MTTGMDEAGRGPVMGPMIIVAYWTEDEDGLRTMGVRDSKLLTPLRREHLASALLERGAHATVVIPASSIDSARERMTMNELEVKCFSSAAASLLTGSELMSRGVPEGVRLTVSGRSFGDRLIKVDAADVVEERFGKDIEEGIRALAGDLDLKVLSLHKADRDHPSVGAASIIAKVERDRAIKSISRELGEDIGSGYPADPVTKAFLEGWTRRNGSLPPHCRSSWETARRALSCSRQSNLMNY